VGLAFSEESDFFVKNESIHISPGPCRRIPDMVAAAAAVVGVASVVVAVVVVEGLEEVEAVKRECHWVLDCALPIGVEWI
jgi:hypothetical protein